MESKKNVVHVIAGGLAGTAGAVLTCPLEVVKIRLQSSTWSHVTAHASSLHLLPSQQAASVNLQNNGVMVNQGYICRSRWSSSLFACLRHIVYTEGVRGLFKGLGPTIVGIAPARAIYFGSYVYSKDVLNDAFTLNRHVVHLCSAVVAGVSAATCTNPIWVVKTRLQLDPGVKGRLTCQECIKKICRENGIRGFYKGITASYIGVSETVIHLVLYEALKASLDQKTNHDRRNSDGFTCSDSSHISSSEAGKDLMVTSNYLKYMLIGACSKTFATCVCYPHDLVRTRLREEGSRYTSFFQAIYLVLKEEGKAGLYRGLWTQLVKQIPNTAIVMATYETIVHVLTPSD